VARVQLPFSALNDVPGVSGVEDTVFDVPSLDEIEDRIDEAFPRAPEIGEEVGLNILDDIEELFPTGEEVGQEITDQLDLAGDFADEVGNELVGTFEDGVLDPFVTEVEGLVEGLQAGIDDVQTAVEEDLQAGLGDLGDGLDDLQAGLDDLQTGIDDVQTGIEDARSALSDLPDDVAAAVEDAVVPSVDGVSLVEDPVEFIRLALLAALAAALGRETRQALDSLDETLGRVRQSGTSRPGRRRTDSGGRDGS